MHTYCVAMMFTHMVLRVCHTHALTMSFTESVIHMYILTYNEFLTYCKEYVIQMLSFTESVIHMYVLAMSFTHTAKSLSYT